MNTSILTKTTPASTDASSGFYVRVQPKLFRMCWIVIVLLYALCAMFFGFFAFVYWKLPAMSMGFPFEIYRITVPTRFLFIPALCYTAVALAHVFCLLELIFYCAWHRRLTFDINWFRAGDQQNRASMIFSRIKSKMLTRPIGKCSHILLRVFGRRGILGVESQYFELVYIVREVVETVLQTTQAYAMSTLVSRAYLPQLFSVMIFVNCWATPILLHILPQDLPLARLSCLLLDIGLDFISTVLVPLALVVPYFQYYDPQATDFTFTLWYDDVLLVKLLNEFRLVMVNTWPELATRMLFSVRMLSCLENSRYLLRPHHSKAQTHPILVSSPREASLTLPQKTPARKHKPHQRHKASHRSLSHRIENVMHVVLMIWGLAVLIIHLQASSRTKLQGCALQVNPWFASKSACALMYVSCRNNLTNGTESHLDELMRRMDEKSLVHIVIRHCSDVQIPARIKTFPRLVGTKIYNSTLSAWESDAALTNQHHPSLVFFFLVDVNMTRIPDGLLAEDFPHQLQDIEISGSNLTQLPDILDQRWSTSGVFVLELCSFKVFPIVLSRLKLTNLMIGNNQFTEIPAEMFTSQISQTLVLSNNPIRILPSKLVASVSPKYVALDNTELATLPSWVDGAFSKKTILSAVGTLACEQTTTALKRHSTDFNSITTLVSAYRAGRFNCDHVGAMSSPYYPRYLENQLDDDFADV